MIPFYVFTSLLANNSYHESSGTTGRWSTFFDSENTTNLIFMMLWLLGTVMAGLHFISLTFDLYLVVIFRRIARLPPDMNPLEDNLTSRSKKNKHKYKDSDATLAIADTFDKKRLSDMSQSTLTVSHPSPDRGSKVRDPLLPDVGARNISFFHTRNDSNASFNPHNPRTARLSRSQFEMEEKGRMYQQPFSSRASRIDVASEREPTLAELQASLVNRSAVSLAPPPRNPARDSAHSFVSALSTPKETFNGGRTDSPVSPIADDSKSDNSFVAKDTASSFRTSKTNIRPAHGRSKSQYDFDLDTNSGANSPNPYNGGTVRRPNSYQPLPQSSNIHIDTPSPAPPMRPLAMNPPSPMYAPDLHSTHGVIEKERDTDSFSLDSGSHYSTTTDGQSVSAVSSAALPPTVPMHAHGRNNSNSIGTNLRSSATPKGKYYGDLASAQLGIRGDSNSPVRLEPPSASIDVQDFAAPPPDVPRYSATAAGKKGEVKSVEKASRPRSWLGGGLAASYDYSVGSGSEKGSPNPNLYSADRSPYLQQGGWGGANANASASAAKSSYTSSPASAYANGKGHEKNGEWRQDRSTPTRVVSRSGVEYEGANVVGVGGGRRRDVSGKIAEEGRGGWGGFGGPGSGMRGRKASAGVVQG